MRGVIHVATCQFAVGEDVVGNAKVIKRQIVQSGERGADVVHFPECALSGYAGVDVSSWSKYDWERLRDQTVKVCEVARQAGVWVVVGSSHQLTGDRLPHNCSYVINPYGAIVDRYDKRFCTEGDLVHYSPGDHFVTFEVNGVTCGLLICYDVRFPELYREYAKLGVQCLFHSFYNARANGDNIHTVIMPPTIQTRAASNYMWVSANNACGKYQSWPSMLVQPDGVVVERLRRHTAGVMVNEIDTRRMLYDAAGENRDLAMQGILNSGKLVDDERSLERESL